MGHYRASLVWSAALFGGWCFAAEPPAKPEIHIEPQMLLRGAALWDEASPEVREQAIELLRERLKDAHGPIHAEMQTRIQEKQEADREPVWTVVGTIALAGPLLLLIPLFTFRRYPGRLRVLCVYSALAAVLFSTTVLFFFLPLAIFLSLWQDLALGIDPRLRVLDAAFNVLDRNADSFLSRDLPLEQTFAQMQDGGVDSFLTVLMGNLAEIKEQAQVLRPVVELYRQVEWVLGSLPKAQVFVATLLFVRPMVPLFFAIMSLPLRAAAGEPRQARRIAGLTVRHWWREVATLLVVLLLFLAVGAADDGVLALVIDPMTDTALRFLLTVVDYLGNDAQPSFIGIYAALASVALFSLFGVVTMTLGLLFYLSKVLRIVRLRFHDGVPLRQHAAFWKWGTLSFLWVQALPLLFVNVGFPIIDRVAGWLIYSDQPRYLAALLLSGLFLLGGFVAAFWLGRGFRALRYLFFYPVPAPHVDWK